MRLLVLLPILSATVVLVAPRVGAADEAGKPSATAHAPYLDAALYHAAEDGRFDAARRLIGLGADVDAVFLGDGTALIAASRRGDLAMVRLLLGAGADPDGAAPGDGNPLIVAAAAGELAVVVLLVESGADVDGYVRGDETPLINAAGQNHGDVARYLLGQGADVNLAVDSGNGKRRIQLRSPHGQARRFGHGRMVRLLERYGARSVGREN